MLSNQSTIYRRHEKRMRKSYQLSHDKRSAPIRVLSGLPVFRNFLKLDDPKNDQTNTRTKEISDKFASTGFSHRDDTVFHLYDKHGNQSIEEGKGLFISTNHIPLVFFSGCIGGVMEATLGRSKTDVLSRAFHQVSLINGNLNYNNFGTYSQPILQTNNMNRVSSFQESAIRLPVLINERVVASAFAAGLLFGSNAYFRSYFSVDEGGRDQSHPFSASFIAASAATGFTTATIFSPFELVRSRLLMQQACSDTFKSPFAQKASKIIPSSISARSVILELQSVIQRHGFSALFKGGSEVYSREMLGNIVYFSTYELMKSTLSNHIRGDQARTHHQSQEPSVFQIALSGASAGVTYWALIYPIDTLKATIQAQSIRSPRFQTAMSAVQGIGLMNLYRGYLSTVVRAAPANAILFLGYESALSIFKVDK